VRVSGKKIDDLRTVITYFKEHGPSFPLQFSNLT
jgi:uncharacterized protein YajQ (UPF0234 family)